MNFDLPLPPAPATKPAASDLATSFDFPAPPSSSGALRAITTAASPSFELPPSAVRAPLNANSGQDKEFQRQVDQAVKEEVRILKKHLQSDFEEELLKIKEQHAAEKAQLEKTLEAKQQAVQDEKMADLHRKAMEHIASWRNRSNEFEADKSSLEQELNKVQQQLQRAQHSQGANPAASALQEEHAATIARLTKETDSLKQENQQLQHQIAVKAEDTNAQQQLAESQTRLVGLERDLAEATHKAEEQGRALEEAQRIAKQGQQEAAEARNQLAQKEKENEGFCRTILEQTKVAAEQYAGDVKKKDEEIMRLKDRSTHRQGSNGRKRSHDDLHDRRDSSRN